MATPYQNREFQRADNAWTQHHCPDLLGRIRVDSIIGPSAKKVSLRAARYLGVGLPTVREWDKHFSDEAIAELTDWFRHPSHFYATHPKAKAAGEGLMAAARERPAPVDGLLVFDGAHVAAWIVPILEEARRRGWLGTIPDKRYGGFRTYADQDWLFTHDPPPVASPDLPSNHQLKDWPGGAVDCSYYEQLDRILRGMGNGSDLGRWGSAPTSDPVHFSSHVHFRQTGHY